MCYYHGFMGGKEALLFDATIDPGVMTTNKIYSLLGNSMTSLFFNFFGDKNNSNYVIGRDKDTTYTDDDLGTNYYPYLHSYYTNTIDIENIYVQTNSIPSYVPSFGLTDIKGLWKTETSNGTQNYYAVGYNNRGWFR